MDRRGADADTDTYPKTICFYSNYNKGNPEAPLYKIEVNNPKEEMLFREHLPEVIRSAEKKAGQFYSKNSEGWDNNVKKNVGGFLVKNANNPRYTELSKLFFCNGQNTYVDSALSARAAQVAAVANMQELLRAKLAARQGEVQEGGPAAAAKPKSEAVSNENPVVADFIEKAAEAVKGPKGKGGKKGKSQSKGKGEVKITLSLEEAGALKEALEAEKKELRMCNYPKEKLLTCITSVIEKAGAASHVEIDLSTKAMQQTIRGLAQAGQSQELA